MPGLEMIDAYIGTLKFLITTKIRTWPRSGNLLKNPMGRERQVVVTFSPWPVFLLHLKFCTAVLQRTRFKYMLTWRGIPRYYEWFS